jgi:heavy metal sensor kinase
MIFTRSIRWRIQAWHALLLTLVIVGFGITAHRLAATNRLRVVDQELQALVARLGIAVPPTPASGAAYRPPPKPGASTIEQLTAGGAHFIVWNVDGTVQASSANLPVELHRPEREGTREATYMKTFGDMRQAVHFTGAGRCFIVGRPIAQELAELRQLAGYLTAAGAGVLSLGLLGGWWMAARAMRPIVNISETAEKIATGDLAQRIPTASTEDELGKLTNILNSTFSRLDAAFTQQARFSADAAHELRTPVSVVLTHAENGLATANLSEEQRESFDACRRAARRMRSLIESLLQLARLDAGQELHSPQNIDLAELALDAIELVQPLAEQRGIAIHDQLQHVTVRADAERLMQVLINLMTNAIQYNRDQGEVRVSLHADNGSAVLCISDNGLGIAPQHQPHLFERFYRADTSRSGKDGHSGLGLAISKAIIDAHGGTIEVTSVPDQGTTFTLGLPVV